MSPEQPRFSGFRLPDPERYSMEFSDDKKALMLAVCCDVSAGATQKERVLLALRYAREAVDRLTEYAERVAA